MFKISDKEKKFIKYFSKYILSFKKLIIIVFILMLLTSSLSIFIPLIERDLLDKGLMRGNFN